MPLDLNLDLDSKPKPLPRTLAPATSDAASLELNLQSSRSERMPDMIDRHREGCFEQKALASTRNALAPPRNGSRNGSPRPVPKVEEWQLLGRDGEVMEMGGKHLPWTERIPRMIYKNAVVPTAADPLADPLAGDEEYDRVEDWEGEEEEEEEEEGALAGEEWDGKL
jgi:hypothetical protein